LAIETLSERDNACLAQLNVLAVRLRDGIAHDASLGETLRMLESAQAELQEAVYALRHYQQRLDTDPQRLREQELRIQGVMDAARKHRIAPELLDQALQRIVARLAELGGDADLAALQQQEKSAQQGYLAAAQKLTVARKKAATSWRARSPRRCRPWRWKAAVLPWSCCRWQKAMRMAWRR